MPETIEDIILYKDARGISALRPYLPNNFCTQAAQYILNNKGLVLITTGFYVLKSNAPETDGPPGAFALGSALSRLGFTVVYVAARPISYIMNHYLRSVGESSYVLDYPLIEDPTENERMARYIISTYKPSLLISIERSSHNAQGQYLNMHGDDVGSHTAHIDNLFLQGKPSVGIGDGGNEIGMGNLKDVIQATDHLPNNPSVVECTHLIIASVSNWGGYGLVSALSVLAQENLLPTPEQDTYCLQHLVSHGVVEGISGEQKPVVDGFDIATNQQVLQTLRQYIQNALL